MGKAENRNKSQKMATDMLKRGIYHGKRLTKGVSNIPGLNEVGSAAYRRRKNSRGVNTN